MTLNKDKIEKMTDEQLGSAIKENKSVAEILSDEVQQRLFLNFEELKRLRAKLKTK